jgi:pyruvate formate lyase activating enzyme
MRIVGVEKSSFVDYPGRTAAVLFTPGCNMDCFYCHNRHLLAPGEHDHAYDEQDVLAFLRKRIGMLEGVVISGGEPTLQKDLEPFIAEIKTMGYNLKLDTNGTRPWVVNSLIDKKLVDFIAMDIKAPPSRYEEITRRQMDLQPIEESIDLLLEGRVDYEFRTTVAPQLSTADILLIATRIRRSKRYVLQQYRTPGLGVDMFGVVDSPRPRPAEFLHTAARLAGRFVRHCEVRGADRPAGMYIPQNTPAIDKQPTAVT